MLIWFGRAWGSSKSIGKLYRIIPSGSRTCSERIVTFRRIVTGFYAPAVFLSKLIVHFYRCKLNCRYWSYSKNAEQQRKYHNSNNAPAGAYLLGNFWAYRFYVMLRRAGYLILFYESRMILCGLALANPNNYYTYSNWKVNSVVCNYLKSV